MDRYIWSVRNKQEDIARAVIDNDGAWAAMAAHEIVMRASHAIGRMARPACKGPQRS
ncbi:hypothetical protein [Variovorax sp. dw_308]|uniref:hypothetical protein n=1 Tax=Variovorax sp. dw_308 TaxID=2721546 RepID=UPI001C493299|nr:hypothetical protein [Variovorax sp. dw_308]